MTTTILLPNVPELLGLPINEQILGVELADSGSVAAISSSNGLFLPGSRR